MTRQPIEPSSAIKFKSAAAASRSLGSCCDSSAMAKRSRWRNSAESSNPSLASAANSPSLVSASGLTSNMVASVATNRLYRRLI